MMTTETELRSLDCFIAVNLFGWDMTRKGWCASALRDCKENMDVGFPPESIHLKSCVQPHIVPHYSTNGADAMKVLERCIDRADAVLLAHLNQMTIPAAPKFCVNGADINEGAETLPLAICLFAKALWSK